MVSGVDFAQQTNPLSKSWCFFVVLNGLTHQIIPMWSWKYVKIPQIHLPHRLFGIYPSHWETNVGPQYGLKRFKPCIPGEAFLSQIGDMFLFIHQNIWLLIFHIISPTWSKAMLSLLFARPHPRQPEIRPFGDASPY